MRVQNLAAALTGVALVAAAANPLVAQANHPHPVPRPVPHDPAYDRLEHQRFQLLNLSQRLFNSTNSFYAAASRAAQSTKVVYDRYYGRRVVRVTDPYQRAALSAAGSLLNAASAYNRYQVRFRNCGPYERSRGLCNRNLAQELSLLRNLRHAHQNLKLRDHELRVSRTRQGLQLLNQIQLIMKDVVRIYKQAGVIEAPRRNPRPLPRHPVPAPRPGQPNRPAPIPQQPAPLPAPRPEQPAPAPAPAPQLPADPAQALRLAEQVSTQAKQAQQQAQQFRGSQADEVAVESIDALVLAVDNVLELLRAQNIEEAKYAAQQLEIQFNATDAAVEMAMQRSNNLSGVKQTLDQMEPSVRQLVQLVSGASSPARGGGAEAGNGAPVEQPQGGYGPGDRPPYED